MSYKQHDNRQRSSSGYAQSNSSNRKDNNYYQGGRRDYRNYDRGSDYNKRGSLQTERAPHKPKFQKGNQMERPNQVVVPEAVSREESFPSHSTFRSPWLPS